MATISNPATLSSVKSVLGGALTLYGYRRGVGTANINHFSGVSTTTPLLSSFAGKIYPVIDLPIVSAQEAVGTPALATATLSYASSGSCSGSGWGSGTWLLAGVNLNYEIMLNKTSGPDPVGDSVNTWLSLATTRSWSNQVSNGSKFTSGYIAIRDTLNNVELANTGFSIDAESS